MKTRWSYVPDEATCAERRSGLFRFADVQAYQESRNSGVERGGESLSLLSLPLSVASINCRRFRNLTQIRG